MHSTAMHLEVLNHMPMHSVILQITLIPEGSYEVSEQIGLYRWQRTSL